MYNAPAPWAQESSSGAHANQNATPIQANQYQYYPPIFYGSTNSQSQWMSSWQQITYNAPNLYSLSGTVPYSTAGNTQPAQSESDQDRQSSSYYQQQQQPNSHSASSAPYFASASQQRPVIMDGEEPREMNLVNPRDPNPLGLMANGVSGQNGPPFPAAAGNMYTSQNASYHGWQQYPIYTYPPSLPMNAHIVLGTSPSQTAPTSQRAPVAEEKHGSLNLVDSQAQNSFTAVKNSVAAGTGSMRTTQANISSDGGRNSSYNDPPQPHNHSASISAAVGALPPASAPHQAAVPVAEKLPQDPNAVADSALREYVPSPLPEELAALVDSYLFGRPLTIILSGGVLEKHWSMKLPAEYGYAMLGFFKIIGVQETRVDVEGEADKSINRVQNTMSGRVRWKFHLQWAPGGEGLIFPQKSPSDLEYPWWNPPSPSQELQEKRNTELEAGEIPEEEPKKDFEADDPESTYLSTPRYRDARTRNHEYKFRNLPLGDLYDSVVPMHLLMPFGEDYMDLSFPRGWCCAECGRMNFQAALRHRKCPSSLCKDKKAPLAPYAQTLFLLRDPQERLPLSSPLNNFPEHLITTSVIQFPSGWQTFSYYLKKNPKIFMKHIFTSNVPSLQTDASDLLRDIQLNVPILRPLTESSQYFLWSAKCLKKITSPTDTKWTNIPETMNLAKELIVKGMRSFGGLKEDQVAVNHLSVVAWITVGSKKGIDLIRAKNKPVTFLALGCTVVLTVTPKSMGGLPTLDDKAQDATAESGQLPKTDIVDHDADTGGWIADNHEDGGGGAEESIEITKKGKTIAKSTKPSFVITLMHGDMMVFHGDEFEYSVKRDGTSLLLIASHDSLGHA
ncbi:hypothetical protein BDN70DRAFT_359669 [Pholiota conissans]|uniref:Uncharacterized protein n=1 Tax=Pholiota conissans TaxID=109636 RepID=A0A9P6CWL7_9AGAR|nr:hypothetical protein BDN70DRAFT_359669 [Pholiota conissans]